MAIFLSSSLGLRLFTFRRIGYRWAQHNGLLGECVKKFEESVLANMDLFVLLFLFFVNYRKRLSAAVKLLLISVTAAHSATTTIKTLRLMVTV